MRNLFILRGTPASGKSSWIKENNLEPYTLSSDEIRLMYQSPVTNTDGNRCISQNYDKEVWDLLLNLLETKMSKGEFIIIDATHYKSPLISRYKGLAHKYRYRVNVVDFSDVPEEECIRRNAERDVYKRVPEETIRKMYACIRDDSEVKKAYKMLTPTEAALIVNTGLKPAVIDDTVNKVVIFGDIHGCYAPIQKYFKENPFNDNYCYIFCGDYTDRGIQNKQVLEFLISIYKKPNVFLIEGNHECMHRDTEILTDRGWINLSEIVEKRIACRPLTYNISKDCIELDEIKEYHKKFQKKMILIETNNTQQVVSFKHDVLLGNVKVKAEELLSYTPKQVEGINKLIRPTSFMQQEDYKIEDNWLRLITWVVCDGSLVDAHKNKPDRAPKLRVQFKLSKTRKIKALEELLQKMNIVYTKKEATMSGRNKEQPYFIRIYGDFARQIFNFFPEDKEFPKFFEVLSNRQAQIVLETIGFTDGRVENKRLYFYSSNKKNISIIQTMCVKNNLSFTRGNPIKGGFITSTPRYACRITKNWDWVKLNNKVSLFEYNDYAYCLTTNNGTLITRIGGKCAITGNCWTRMYASKEYVEPEKKENEYNDFYIDSVINQIKFKQSQVDKKIRRNTQTMNELSSLFKEAQQENPGCKEVIYEFETVNVPERQKQLSMENSKLSAEASDLKEFVSILSHEKNNSKNTLLRASIWYEEEFGEKLSLNIKNLLRKKLNMEEVTFDNPIKSKEFLNNTVPQIREIDKADLRQLCDRFIQMSYFAFNGSYFVVTHAGLPCVPDIFTPTQEMIKGVGKYEDHELIDATFEKNTPSNFYQIHGHRNSFKVPIKNGRTFNLEGGVEFGGCLRVLEISKEENDVKFHCIEIQNDVFKVEEQKKDFEEQSDLEVLKDMIHSKLIQVKNLEDNIISLNFTREAFYDRKWNDLTCHARGLFVNKTTGDVVARSYSKFFNKGEVPETETAGLKENFVFPVVGYKKENGFLGIISKYKDKVRFFTKSSDSGDYVNWFIGALCENYGVQMLVPKGLLIDGMQYDTLSYTDAYNRMIKAQGEISSYKKDRKFDQPNDLDWDYMKSLEETVAWCNGVCNGLKEKLANRLSPNLTEGYSYVFECADPNNDPHIIKYEKPTIFLLEVFKNQLKEEHCSWEDLIGISDGLRVPLKQRELEFNTWEEFVEWKDKFTKDVTQWDCKHEGYVFEDTNGFRVKFKSSFYNFWKQMRSVKDGIAGGRGNRKIYKTKEEIQVVKLLESIPREQLKEMSIIDVERKFYETYKG